MTGLALDHPLQPSGDPYTRLVSSVIFPLHEWLKRHATVAVHREMEVSQWWDQDRLKALQLERLRTLLRHAGTHVPYYRRLFAENGFQPEKVESVQDLARLPLLTKALIRAHTEDLKSDDARDLARFNTGGSSGEPLIFYIGKQRVSHDVAAKWRATRWWGVDIGDPEIVVWGSPIELGRQDRVKAMRDRLLRTRLLPAFEMSQARLDGFIEEIRAFKPRMLFGYPSALAHIARHAEVTGWRMDDLGIKVAFVTSERLYDHQRAQIEKIFGCRVANGYGGRDAGFIAHECPAGGMHITAEDIVVEIVDEAGRPLPPGASGEVVVTHLATRDFPFIRYRTGDVAILDDKSCSCGRGLPLIREVQGRTTDFIVAQDGTVMHGLALIYIIRDLPGVRQFKIVQNSLDETRILLATDDSFREPEIENIKSGVRQRLGMGVRVEVERVAGIPKEASGKYRYVVSHVAAAANASVGT
ncbi:MAG: phenylacetate--CoA ligase family protein [Gammaproteobacteria bacterium]|nr:phenylacetate--CoA ligase family protein [Gammaproteobacteria bacterium]